MSRSTCPVGRNRNPAEVWDLVDSPTRRRRFPRGAYLGHEARVIGALRVLAERHVKERQGGVLAGRSSDSLAQDNYLRRARLAPGEQHAMDVLLLEGWDGTWFELLAAARLLGGCGVSPFRPSA